MKKAGACTIPARKLYDYIKLLPEGDISIKLMDNHWVQIRAGRSNTRMVGMARANFPAVPEFPAAGAVKLPTASLKNMIYVNTPVQLVQVMEQEPGVLGFAQLPLVKQRGLPEIATDRTGQIVVTWSGSGPGDANHGIFARRLAVLGLPSDSAEFLVNSFTANYQTSPSVARYPAGFVVAWKLS